MARWNRHPWLAASIVGIAISMLLLAEPGAPAAAQTPGAPRELRVVTTIFPYADVVAAIGGPHVHVTYLLPAGASPHTFEPRPSQIRAAARADLIIWNGAQLDDWARQLAAAGNPDAVTLVLSEGIDLLPWGDTGGHGDGDGGHHHGGHSHGAHDPHIWLDPLLMRDQLAPRIAGALSRLAPGLADTFAANLARFQQELTELHEELLDMVADLPVRQFIVHHSAWRYFAHRYGLEEVGAVVPSPGQEASAQGLAQLVALAREAGIRTVFSEPQLNPQAMQVIAAEIGAGVDILDPLGDASLPDRGSYVDLLRFNARALVKALSTSGR